MPTHNVEKGDCWQCGKPATLTTVIRDVNIAGKIARDIEDSYYECLNGCEDEEGLPARWYLPEMLDATSIRARAKLGLPLQGRTLTRKQK